MHPGPQLPDPPPQHKNPGRLRCRSPLTSLGAGPLGPACPPRAVSGGAPDQPLPENKLGGDCLQKGRPPGPAGQSCPTPRHSDSGPGRERKALRHRPAVAWGWREVLSTRQRQAGPQELPTASSRPWRPRLGESRPWPWSWGFSAARFPHLETCNEKAREPGGDGGDRRPRRAEAPRLPGGRAAAPSDWRPGRPGPPLRRQKR